MKNKVEVEVCVYSLESCLNAQMAGATRVELCTGMYDGGLTPSAAIIQMARELLFIELYVMIRPRGGDFLYSNLEFEQMKEEILYAKSCGVDGVVVGVLLADGRVDVERMKVLVECAAPLKVTFHRAIDMTRNMEEALEDVIESGCCRILTSGGEKDVEKGKAMIKRLIALANGRIEIMAGAGVNTANTLVLSEYGVDAVHLSGKKHRESKMDYRNPKVSMGGVSGISEYQEFYSDMERIEAVVRQIN